MGLGDGDLTDDALVVEIELRTAPDVAARLVVLGAVCRRAFLEARPDEVADDGPEAERYDLAAWLRGEGLASIVSPAERALLDAPLGRLDAEAVAAASWQSEAMVALGWALGLVDAMPPYDRAADPASLLSSVPAPWEATAPFRDGARLRDETAVAFERERAEVWHWRAETEEALTFATRRDRAELLAAVREVAGDALAAGILPRLAGDDFPASDRPYRDLDPAALVELGAIAAERLRALNWLCGFGSNWDDVPLAV